MTTMMMMMMMRLLKAESSHDIERRASDYNAQFFVAKLVNRRNDNGRQMTTLHVNAQVHIRYNCRWTLTRLYLARSKLLLQELFLKKFFY